MTHRVPLFPLIIIGVLNLVTSITLVFRTPEAAIFAHGDQLASLKETIDPSKWPDKLQTLLVFTNGAASFLLKIAILTSFFTFLLSAFMLAYIRRNAERELRELNKDPQTPTNA